MSEIFYRRAVVLLDIMSILKLKAGMHWCVILSHVLLEMCLEILRILLKDWLSVNWVLLEIAFVRPRFRREVKLSLCIMHHVRVISISWQVGCLAC